MQPPSAKMDHVLLLFKPQPDFAGPRMAHDIVQRLLQCQVKLMAHV